MNVDKTIKSVVESNTGFTCYALEKPKDKPVPCVVYRIIDENKAVAHSGDTSSRKVRVQFTCVADTYTKLKSLVANLESGFIANITNFEVSLPLSTKIENKEDNLYYSISEYYVRYTK